MADFEAPPLNVWNKMSQDQKNAWLREHNPEAKQVQNLRPQGVDAEQQAAELANANDPGGIKRSVWSAVQRLMPTAPQDPAAAAQAQNAQMQNSLNSQARAMAAHRAIQSGKLTWDDLPTQLQQDLINSPDVGDMYQGVPK